jgi:hypothetical protein
VALEDPKSKTVWADRSRHWFTRWFVEWWLLEIISWLFSASCMVVIVAILFKFEGKLVLDWKGVVSIGTFISILSGFVKSALLLPTAEALGQLKWDWFRSGKNKMMDFETFDSASRGAWGSLLLLVRTRRV